MRKDPFEALFSYPVPPAPDTEKSIRDIEGRRSKHKRCPNCGEYSLREGEDAHGRYQRCRVCKQAWSVD